MMKCFQPTGARDGSQFLAWLPMDDGIVARAARLPTSDTMLTSKEHRSHAPRRHSPQAYPDRPPGPGGANSFVHENSGQEDGLREEKSRKGQSRGRGTERDKVQPLQS